MGVPVPGFRKPALLYLFIPFFVKYNIRSICNLLSYSCYSITQSLNDIFNS